MPDQIEIRIPDIGDFEDVEIVEILVGPGDRVEVEANVVLAQRRWEFHGPRTEGLETSLTSVKLVSLV